MFFHDFKYQIIKNPITANTNPPVRSWLSFTSFNFDSIFFIFDGNKAYKIPSMNKNRPNAMINSFIGLGYSDLGFIFPKNLKNSLSGDKIIDVSPALNAFPYACIDL